MYACFFQHAHSLLLSVGCFSLSTCFACVCCHAILWPLFSWHNPTAAVRMAQSKGRTPGLRMLTSKILGLDIQSGEHSSVEDARATMAIYRQHAKDWEEALRAKRTGKSTKAAVRAVIE